MCSDCFLGKAVRVFYVAHDIIILFTRCFYGNISGFENSVPDCFLSHINVFDISNIKLRNFTTKNAMVLNKYKFLRLFKQETGLTPNNYIILKRVEKCKELLNTQDDLLDIAIETGFTMQHIYANILKKLQV